MKIYIDKFMNRDRLAFNAVSKCGHVTHDQLKSYIADSRIRNYVRDGLMEKVPHRIVGEEKNGTCYKFTKEGKAVAEKQFGIRNNYHAQSANHDMGIANKYFSLDEHSRDNSKTETELREMLIEKFQELRDQGQEETAKMYEDMLNQGLISVPDFAYENEDGVETCFEVITNSYGEAELQAKEVYVQIMQMKYETTRV